MEALSTNRYRALTPSPYGRGVLQDSIPPIAVERRVAARVAVERSVPITTEAGVCAAATVNVSTSGMLVASEGGLTIWAEVVADLPGIGPRAARVVRHDGERYGLVFREPLSADEFTAFTGVAFAAEEPEDAAPAKPAGRVSPWAFGRDRFKTLKREAAERAGGISR